MIVYCLKCLPFMNRCVIVTFFLVRFKYFMRDIV